MSPKDTQASTDDIERMKKEYEALLNESKIKIDENTEYLEDYKSSLEQASTVIENLNRNIQKLNNQLNELNLEKQKKIAEKSFMRRITELQNAIQNEEQNLKSAIETQESLKEKINALEIEIKRLKTMENPNTLEKMRQYLGGKKTNQSLEDIRIENEADNETELDELESIDSSKTVSSLSDDKEEDSERTSLESSASTQEEPYRADSESSSVVSAKTVVSSSKKEAVENIRKELKKLTTDKESYGSLTGALDKINQEIKRLDQEIREHNKNIVTLNQIQYEQDTNQNKTEIEAVIILGENGKAQQNIKVDDVKKLSLNDLKLAFDALKNDVERRKASVDTAQTLEKKLTPSSFLGRVAYVLEFLFARITLRKTGLEKAKDARQQAQTKLDKGQASMNILIQEKTNRLSENIKEMANKKTIKLQNETSKTEKETEINKIEKNYSGKKLSEKMFDEKIDEKTKQLKVIAEIANKEIDIKKLITGCDKNKDFFFKDSSYAVRMSLKKFLQSPTDENLSTLNTEIKNSELYIHDSGTLNLLTQAREAYPRINQIPLLIKMAQSKISTYYDDKLIELENKIHALKEESSTSSEKNEVLDIERKVSKNLFSLSQYHNLLLIARQREKEYGSDASLQYLQEEAKILVSYLEMKRDEILNQLPKEEKEKATKMTQQAGAILDINYEYCHDEINAILKKNGITAPLPPFTLDKIKRAYAHLNDDKKKAILGEINSLESIQEQANLLTNELLYSESMIAEVINELNRTKSDLFDAFDDFLIKYKQPPEIERIFVQFEKEFKENPKSALDNLQRQLRDNLNQYPQLEVIISKIKDSLDPIETFIGPIDKIEEREKQLFQENHEKTQENMEIRNEIRVLEAQKKLLMNTRDQNIQNNVSPTEVPSELKAIIKQCEKEKLAQWKALAQFIKLPSEGNLKKLQQSIGQSIPKNFEAALNKVTEYYPRVAEDLAKRAEQSQETTKNLKTALQETKPENTAPNNDTKSKSLFGFKWR